MTYAKEACNMNKTLDSHVDNGWKLELVSQNPLRGLKDEKSFGYGLLGNGKSSCPEFGADTHLPRQ